MFANFHWWFILRSLRDQEWHLIGAIEDSVAKGIVRTEMRDGKMFVVPVPR